MFTVGKSCNMFSLNMYTFMLVQVLSRRWLNSKSSILSHAGKKVYIIKCTVSMKKNTPLLWKGLGVYEKVDCIRVYIK